MFDTISRRRFAGLLAAPLAVAGCLSLNVASAADDSLSRVQSAGVLRVALDAPYGRMEYYDDAGKLAGVDVDVANAIAMAMEVEVEFVTMPFDELFGALKDNRADVVISAVTITEERQKTLRFSTPYFDAALQVAVRRDDKSIAGLDDLAGKRVGVLSGTVGESFAKGSDLITNEAIVAFKANDARVAALNAGDLDAIIMHFSLKDHPTLRTLPEPISQSYYGVVARLEAASLIDAVNTRLRAMKRDGSLEEIRRRHLGDS